MTKNKQTTLYYADLRIGVENYPIGPTTVWMTTLLNKIIDKGIGCAIERLSPPYDEIRNYQERVERQDTHLPRNIPEFRVIMTSPDKEKLEIVREIVLCSCRPSDYIITATVSENDPLTTAACPQPRGLTEATTRGGDYYPPRIS